MRDIVRAVGTKGSVQRTAVGIPSFSKVIPSCKLLDEQDPQGDVRSWLEAIGWLADSGP